MQKVTSYTAPPSKIMYVRMIAPLHDQIAALSTVTGFKMTTVVHAIVGHALGQPTPHSKEVMRAVMRIRKAQP